MLLEDDRPVKSFISNWRNWVFALALGLLVCISDIRLFGDAAGYSEDTPTIEAAARVFVNDFFTGDVEDVQAADAPTTAFTPPGELMLLPYDRIIHEAAGRYGLDADLIAAVIMTESQFNPGAVSKKGAKGLMQIMPVTADALDLTNVYSPEENIHAGSRHLKWLLVRFEGDVRLALAAYNAGVQNVLTYKGVPPYRETQAYVVKVMENYSAIKDCSISF